MDEPERVDEDAETMEEGVVDGTRKYMQRQGDREHGRASEHRGRGNDSHRHSDHRQSRGSRGASRSMH